METKILNRLRANLLFLLVAGSLASAPFAPDAFSQGQPKPSSIVIHDTTKPGNGGEKATEGLRNEFKSALERERPCVETMDDQDLRDSIPDGKTKITWNLRLVKPQGK